MDSPDHASKSASIADVDKNFPSPDERARHVYAILQKHAPELTDWDVVCFSANYLGWMATTWEWLRIPAKHICNLIYTAHYLLAEKTGIGTGIPHKLRDPEPPQIMAREHHDKRGGIDVSGGGFT